MIDNFAREMSEARDEARARSNEDAKRESVHIQGSRAQETTARRKCDLCGTVTPAGSVSIVRGDGTHCTGCEGLKRYCAMCANPYYSRNVNQRTCGMACGRAYELSKARARHATMREAFNASTVSTEGGY